MGVAVVASFFWLVPHTAPCHVANRLPDHQRNDVANCKPDQPTVSPAMSQTVRGRLGVGRSRSGEDDGRVVGDSDEALAVDTDASRCEGGGRGRKGHHRNQDTSHRHRLRGGAPREKEEVIKRKVGTLCPTVHQAPPRPPPRPPSHTEQRTIPLAWLHRHRRWVQPGGRTAGWSNDGLHSGRGLAACPQVWSTSFPPPPPSEMLPSEPSICLRARATGSTAGYMLHLPCNPQRYEAEAWPPSRLRTDGE